MKMRQSLLGLLVFAAIMVVAGAAHASCGISDRKAFNHSECLHAWWDNNPWPKKSTFGVQVRNDCHLWGTVVAKVDLRSCSDKTWHLNNTNKRRGAEACRVNEISCCQDIGDLCNRRDLVTIDGCTSQWNKSPASNTCYLSGGEYYITNPTGTTTEDFLTSVYFDKDEHTCGFWAKCKYLTPQWDIEERQTSIRDGHWLDSDDLVNCNGVLKDGSC